MSAMPWLAQYPSDVPHELPENNFQNLHELIMAAYLRETVGLQQGAR